jgi:hypothetical protein
MPLTERLQNTMSSEPTDVCAARILDELVALLDEESLERLIDARVDDALAEFPCPEVSECSEADFRETVAKFLGHVRAKVLFSGEGRCLGGDLGEAIALLESEYRGTQGDGYYAAVLDAMDASRMGLQMVLARIGEAFKTHYRAIYAHWAIARRVDALDWRLKCALAAALLDRCREWLPPDIQQSPPEQWADLVPELLESYTRQISLSAPDVAGALFGSR